MIIAMLITIVILLFVIMIYASLVANARMEEQLSHLYQRGWEEQQKNDGEKKENG